MTDERRINVKKWVYFLLAAALMLSLTAEALTEDLFLPDPRKETSSEPAFFEKHQYIKREQEYFDAWFYAAEGLGGQETVDAYLSRCTAAGFTWEKADNFSKYNAYRIEGGGFVAYLIADHEEKWILFTQPGMTLETNINLDDFIFPEDEAVSVPEETPLPAQPSIPDAVIPDIVIATPVPTQAPTEAPPVRAVLPSPSYEFGCKGSLKEKFVQTESYTADGWLYDAENADNVVSAYLSRCRDAGFSWTMGDYLGMKDVYAVFCGDQTAFLTTHYGDQALLIVPVGMEKEPEKPDPEAYEENKLLLTVNGKTRQMDFRPRWYYYAGTDSISMTKPTTKVLIGTPLIFTSESDAYDLVMFALPRNLKVNVTYTARKGERNDLSFMLYENAGGGEARLSSGKLAVSPVIELKSVVGGEGGVNQTKVGNTVLHTTFEAPLNSEKSLQGSGDYFSITPIYANGNEYRGHFEGCFGNGAYQVSGTFWTRQ